MSRGWIVCAILAAACGGDPAVTERTGRISLYGSNSTGGTRASVSLPDDDTMRLCRARTLIGSCIVSEACNPIETETFSIGDVRFGTTPETIVPAGKQGSQDAGAFPPGQVVRISAEGADVDGFETEIEAPSRVTMTSNFDSVPVPSGQDLSLTWSGSQSGHVRLSAYSGTDGAFYYLNCEFDASPGIATIPAEALRLFGGGHASLSHSNSVDLRIETWTLHVDVGFAASWPDGTLAEGSLSVLR